MSWIYFLGTVAFASVGQFLVKWRVDTHGVMPAGLQAKLGHFAVLLLDPYVVLALFLAFLSALCWMATVAMFELSIAYPLLIASSLLVTVAGATVLLHEGFTLQKLAGVLLISAGAVVLVGAR